VLSTSDLLAMREVQSAVLLETATVQRQSPTSDGAGGATESWATVASVACRVGVSSSSSQERALAERVTNVSTWTLTLPVGTDVRVGDRLVVGTRTFEVLAVLSHSLVTALRVVCVEVL
jgi:head-tail adaptor